MDISFELYKVFYHVASTLSFSEASRQLYISQSAVSQSIKSLEQKLGHPLFVRNTKKVELTAEGETLYRHVQPAVSLLSQGENQLLHTTSSEAPLRIGASDTICRYFLVPFLQQFHQEFPEIHIKVTNATSIGCVELLENRQVDFIVCNYPNSRLKMKEHYKTILTFQDVFAANREYFDFEGQKLSLAQLHNYPLLMLGKKSTTSEFLHSLFLQKGLNLTPEVELSSNDLLLDLAYIGLGIAFVPDFVLDKRQEGLYKLQIKEKLPVRQLILAYNGQQNLSTAAKEFLKYFPDVTPSFGDDGSTKTIPGHDAS